MSDRIDDNGPEFADPEKYRELAGFDRDWRDTWWNDDFLQFLLRRWDVLDDAEKSLSVLDVGCGAGHWGRKLLRVLPESARLRGIDIEASFVELASEQASVRDLTDRCEYRQGTAEAIPFGDGEFDIVTCQTVLIHVADVAKALREMMRVTRPGGCVIAAEPDNLTSTASLLAIHPRPEREDAIAILELRMICERGKVELGEGDGSIGGRLPGLFAEAGLERVRVSLNENCPVLLPPYKDGAQPVQLAMELDLARSDCAIFTANRNDTLRWFVAGGGREQDFDGYWDRVIAYLRRFEAGIAARELHGARGQAFYLVAGRKPSHRE